MKTFYRNNSIHAIVWLMLCLNLAAQEDIIFNPAELIPHQDGYYVAGVYVDENEDGIDEFHNGCDDYYESEPDGSPDWFYNPHLNHAESGEQQDFTYVNCMIMPTCEHKSTPIDPPVATGYIQMHACMYSNTDSAIYSYIQSPPVTNLTSIYLETSADVSIQPTRQIPYNIEYSKDYGATWEPAYVHDNVETQGGYRVTYDGSVHLEVQEMIDASEDNPIVLRFITNDRAVDAPQQGQFVKVHSLKLTAELVSSVNNISVDQTLKYQVKDHTITTEKLAVKVYNLSGQLIGIGTQVTVPYAGIFLIKSDDSVVHKVYIE